MRDSELQVAYQHRFEGAENYRDQVWQVLTRDFFQQWVPANGTVIDLGAGYCEFINNIAAANRVALDLNPATRTRAAAGVHVISQDVTQAWPLAADSADVVFTSNFFEHLPSKAALQQCLAEAFRVLKPGGRLIALGPNIRFCGDVYWDFFDHYLPLSDRSLAEGLGITGFALERVVPRFLPFTMVGKKPNLMLVRWYLRLPWAWPLFGKQFLVLARKALAR